jgi:hypothetical protein
MSLLHEHEFELQDLPEGTQSSLTTEWIVKGLKRVTVELRFTVPLVPPTIRLCRRTGLQASGQGRLITPLSAACSITLDVIE